MALTAGLLLQLGFLVIIAGDALGESLAAAYGWGQTFETVWTIGCWPVGVVLAWVSFTVILEHAPCRCQPGFSWLAFGSAVSLALWLLLTGLLALYVVKSGSFGSTYGPLTGIFALLLWANLSSVALFLGVAFAAQLEAVRAGSPEPISADPLTMRRPPSGGEQSGAGEAVRSTAQCGEDGVAFVGGAGGVDDRDADGE
jgi:uncharacterized BrkB/YihY/UPF0761 family membrane protein